ncbi:MULTISPECIES: hypothetical protein [Porphyromonadaceae]|uniref:hypothetical protein n=1 Tax=Porphyromonadaceae TaxID=171551 RepID=UPI000D95A595|nr:MULTISPECIES: hypothetical protein [Porphyromonadaceae]MCR9011954.1 hypothetical protein [Gabonibacter chumensis]PXZ44909.1 hypothetical protein DMB45_00225 [Sanguibacteroides justesenii]
MALEKATIKKEIKTAFVTVMNQQEDREDAIDKVADKIADAVINAIKSVQIDYVTGLVAPPTGGTVTGKFNYIIS